MREETSSITHLVKIVAAEVFEESFSRKIDLIEIDGEEAINSVKSTLEKAGDAWTPREDDLLVKETEMAIAQIAKNHQRSKVSITSRIFQKGLMK